MMAGSVDKGDNTLSITSWNARGYLAATPYLRYLLNRNQIVTMSEHWLHHNRLKVLEEISDTHFVFSRASKYSSADKFGSNRGQGGVAIFWCKDLPGVSTIPNIRHDRICAIRLPPKSGPTLIICSVYLPAMGGQDDLAICLDELTDIILTLDNNSYVIIAGDFNADIGDKGGPRSRRVPTDRGNLLFNFMNRHNFIATNLQSYSTGSVPTHFGPNSQSTLDYVMVPIELAGNVMRCSVVSEHPLNTSDHAAVSVTLKYTGAVKATIHEPVSERVKWAKAGADCIRDNYHGVILPVLTELCMYLDTAPIDPTVIDNSFNLVTSTLINASKRLPHTSYRSHLKPFWNPHLSALKREKVRTYRLWIDAGRPREYDSPVFSDYKRSKNEFAKSLRYERRKFENEQILLAARSAELDRNVFWKAIRQARCDSGVKSLAIKDIHEKIVHEPTEVLGVWKQHFETLGTPKESDTFDRVHFNTVTKEVLRYNKMTTDDEFLTDPFTRDEVLKAVRELHKNKAAGVDCLTAEHLLYAGDALVDTLVILFNMVRISEYVPVCCRVGMQVPLYKGKDTCTLDPNNYRGITLLSVYN